MTSNKNGSPRNTATARILRWPVRARLDDKATCVGFGSMQPKANMIQTEEGWFCNDKEYLMFSLIAPKAAKVAVRKLRPESE